jgi:leucyl/phenylalanyl-tRNA--protein transferase
VEVPRIAIDVRTVQPPAPLPRSPYHWPQAEVMPPTGPVAIGGDFEPSTIVSAYRAGIFPWPHPPEELIWFSPDPRAILPVDGLYVSQRLARTIRQGRFHVTLDAAFAHVVAGCADRPEGTWITPGILRSYAHLHQLGWAHSFEVWTADGALAGGLYGVQVGHMFGAESMFHRVRDASKVAMVALVQWAHETGITLIDIQALTDHTRRMGGIEIPRMEYMSRLRGAIR